MIKIQEMTYNYHAHTSLCGHATGTAEDYVRKAIEGGIRSMGFSDHFPFLLDDGKESDFRIPIEKADQYRKDIAGLKSKYADQINLYIGFEMEYYPTHFQKKLTDARKYGAEYLICGPHYLSIEHEGNKKHTQFPFEESAALKAYAEMVVGAIGTGAFTYIAHPDIANFTGEDTVYYEEMRKICIAARDYNVPLEINFLGIREGRSYPTERFWEIAGEYGAPVTFGFDAHETAAAYDSKSLFAARALVEKYHLNYIGEPTLKKL